jgi:hypothetical protein
MWGRREMMLPHDPFHALLVGYYSSIMKLNRYSGTAVFLVMTIKDSLNLFEKFIVSMNSSLFVFDAMEIGRFR